MCLPSLVTDTMRRFLRLESSKKLQGKNARGVVPTPLGVRGLTQCNVRQITHSGLNQEEHWILFKSGEFKTRQNLHKNLSSCNIDMRPNSAFSFCLLGQTAKKTITLTWSRSLSHNPDRSHMIRITLTWSESLSHDLDRSHLIRITLSWSGSHMSPISWFVCLIFSSVRHLCCDICAKIPGLEADAIRPEMYCVECRQRLCGRCIDVHKTRLRLTSAHQLIRLRQGSSSTTDDASNAAVQSAVEMKKTAKATNCDQHRDRMVSGFCQTCRQLICSVCTAPASGLHKGHELSDLPQASVLPINFQFVSGS